MKSIILCKYKLKDIVRRPLSLFFIFLLPLLIIGTAVGPFVKWISHESFVDRFHLSIVNHDPTVETRAIIQHFAGADTLKEIADIEQMNEQAAIQLLKENKTAAVLIIPEGFSADLTVGKNTPVEVVGNSQRPLQSLFVKEMMVSAANQVSAAQSGVNTVYSFLKRAGVNGEALNRAFQQSIIDFSLHSLGRQRLFSVIDIDNPAVTSPIQYVIVSFFIICLFFWAIFLCNSLHRDASRAVVLRFASLGIKEWNHTFAMLLSLITLLLVFSTTTLFLLILIGKGQVADVLLPLLAFLLICVLAVCCTTVFLQNIFKNSLFFYLFSIGTVLVGSIAGGLLIPVAYFPKWFEFVSLLSIQHWMLDGAFSSLNGEFPVASILILAAYSFCLLIISLVLSRKRGSFQ